MKWRNPRNASEWQEAADCASFMLHFDSAKQYGLIAGGPEVKAERCVEILTKAKSRGVTPRPIDQLIRKYVTR